jgi:hypothetical protein
VVTAQRVVPTALTLGDQAPPPESLYQNPPRPSHPEELLTHQFMPYGSLIGTGASVATEAAMEVDAPEATPIPPTKKVKSKKVPEETPASPTTDSAAVAGKKKSKGDEEGKVKSGKKRKPETKEETTPKKVKKAKVNA